MRRHILVETNPNDVSGGGGCACGIRRTADTTGPYTVWPLTDAEDVKSPAIVVCAPCLETAHAELAGGAQSGGGETVEVVVDAEGVEEEEITI